MPNLQVELGHLKMADAHISLAERKLAHLEFLLEQERRAGLSGTGGERAVQAAKKGLEVFRLHRDLIVTTIEDVKAGRLPST